MTIPPDQSLAEFIVHAHALKSESEEQMEMCAASLRAHNNPAAADAFHSLSQMIGQTIKDIEAMAAGLELPQIAPWDFHWHLIDGSTCTEEAHYLMNERNVLELAQLNEQRAIEYFQKIAEVAINKNVRELAQQLHDQEQRFARHIEQRLQQLEEDAIHHMDLDPANMPE